MSVFAVRQWRSRPGPPSDNRIPLRRLRFAQSCCPQRFHVALRTMVPTIACKKLSLLSCPVVSSGRHAVLIILQLCFSPVRSFSYRQILNRKRMRFRNAYTRLTNFCRIFVQLLCDPLQATCRRFRDLYRTQHDCERSLGPFVLVLVDSGSRARNLLRKGPNRPWFKRFL